jgi:succinoglycan biosynthesis transport protein ExoP
LSKYLRPDHPKIVQLNEQIAEAQNLADNYRNQNQKDITTARQALKIRMDSVKEAITEWEAKVDYDSARIAQAEDLKANIARKTPQYDSLVSLLQNVDLTRNIDQPTLAILEPATPSTRSYAQLKSSVTAAVMGGLGLGLGVILLIAIRDDRFASIAEVSERIGDGVVGQVPEMLEAGGKSGLALLENNDDNHVYVESYRSLRSALLFFSVNGERPKMILITSAIPSEGKSTIASNLACTMALGGARVLLVDADLRKGRLHDILDTPSKPGLSELLLEPHNLDQFIQTTSVPNLSFIPRGASRRNPGDLFLNPAFINNLAQMRERYDYVIVDSCPVFAADDSTTLAPKMDGVLFVVRSNFSRAAMVREALELLQQRQANILGLILNRTNSNDRSYYYYKYSEYHPSPDAT